MSKAVRAGVVVVVAVLAACSSGGKQAEAPTTTSTLPPTTQVTSTTLSQEKQVKAAYLAYWQWFAGDWLRPITNQGLWQRVSSLPWNTLGQAGRCARVRTAWMIASTASTTTSGCPLGERCTRCPLCSAMAWIWFLLLPSKKCIRCRSSRSLTLSS